MTDNILVPDGITPVVGWRAWRVKDDGIQSINYGGLWTPRAALEAACSDAVPAPATGGTVFWSAGYTVVSLPHSAPPPGHRNGTPILKTVEGQRFVNIGGNTLVPLPENFQVEGAPAEACSCGVYAAKSIQTAQSYAILTSDTTNMPIPDDYVVGRVALWGKVIVYTEGWRGQYAYPQAFYVSNSFKHRSVLEQFGVPILNVSELGDKSGKVKTEPPKNAVTTAKLREWRKQGRAVA